MDSITSHLQYWLVSHPNIINFTWNQSLTFASSPQFLTLAVLTYLSLTLALSRIPLPSLGPLIIKPITALHSLTLLLLSLVMSLGCILSIVSYPPHDLHHILCFPPRTPPSGPLFFWAYIFYLSKILEFIDTLLIILSNSIQRLTFLHVYHHATVLIMCYLWLSTSQSLFPVALVTNATVHVVMYLYYLLCAMGIRPKWKRLVTDFQIVQFVFSFAVSALMLYYHFTGLGCSGIWGWCFNAVFNASLLALFVDFHGKSYDKRRRDGKDKRIFVESLSSFIIQVIASGCLEAIPVLLAISSLALMSSFLGQDSPAVTFVSCAASRLIEVCSLIYLLKRVWESNTDAIEVHMDRNIVAIAITNSFQYLKKISLIKFSFK